MSDVALSRHPRPRIRIFIDFWNFSLELRRRDDSFRLDWSPIAQVLTKEAGRLIDPTALPSYEGMHVYGSFDPDKPADAKFKNWFTNWLDKQPGVHAKLLPRQKKRGYPKCPKCHAEVMRCVDCNTDMRGTEEKGVDSHIVKDMIALAWEDAYDAAVLVSADRDFIPVAEFLQTKAIKVIHGGFPPKGNDLSQKCWATINIWKLTDAFKKSPLIDSELGDVGPKEGRSRGNLAR